MSRNYLILLIIAGFVGLLLGCHAGGNSPMAPDNSATTVSPETRTVGTNGRFTDITFPSGAVIKCPSDSTFQEGVKVTATEEKVPVITDNSGKFSYIYVYNISAVLPSENSLTADVPVNTIEKPLSVTLPNDSTAGTCYIGTRASDKDPWRYSLATDGIVSNARFMRLSANSPKTFTFNLFRLNIQFRLFVFDNEEKKDEVQVDTIAMVPAEDVEIKDGKYTGKLTVKLNVEGENLKGLKSEDLIAKITYRSENQQGANIDFTTNKNDSSDKAVTGSYEHSFEVSNIKVENTLGNTAELSFELNLDGVSLDDFPKDFLVEFYSKGSDENTRPFEYTQAFSFETREQTDTQTDTDTNTESGTDTQTNTDSGTETNTESSTDTGSSIDTGSATDTGSSTSTGSSTDTGSGTGTDTSVETYSITYELDGGEPTGSNPTSYDENTDDISLSNPTKEGYTFTGWTGTDLDNPTTQVIIEKGSTGNREYTANWKQNAADEFTLSLVAGTGIASVDEEKAYKKATSITLNCTVKDGYEFVNWTDSNGNAVTSPFTMPEKAVTLTANAKVITYNLEYFLDGGNFEKDNPKTYTVETENFDLNDPKKDGYAFLGWTSSEITAPLTPVSIKKGSTGDKKFIANYSPINYTLTYNLDGGQLTKDNPTEYTVETKTFTLNEPTKVGYTFIGWTGSNGDTPQKPVSVVQGSKSDLNYVANYSIINYALIYNLDNGQLTKDNPTTYNVETESFSLTNPTKDYYDFLGWSGTGLTGNNNTTVTVSKGSTGAREYTANFTLTNYTITYTNIDGATFATANPTTYNVETETFTLTKPTKDDYLFLGWTYEGQTTPQLEVTITKGSTTGNKAYTANWKLNLTLTIASDTGSVFEPLANNLYKLKPTFTITPVIAAGTVITDTEKNNILGAISVKDSNSNALNTISKSWENGKIALSFSEALTASSTYTISFDDIDGVDLTCTPLNFTTICFSGSGTSEAPFLVATAAQLDMVRKYPSYHFKQTADIDLSGFTCWNALCGEYDNSWNPTNPFTGVYDGDSKKIKNFTIHSSEFIEYAGLFGFVNAGTIKNLTVDGFSIRGATENDSLNVDFLGIIAAQIDNNASIKDCHITDSRVTNATDSISIATVIPYGVGGICSINYSGTISNCSVGKCKIICSVDNADGVYLGGICKENRGSISNCEVDELIIACSVTNLQQDLYIGGICSDSTNSSVITNCSVKNTSITGSKGDSGFLFLGGICSMDNGRIEICDVQNTTVKGTGNNDVYVGGISGYTGNNGNSITGCHVEDSTVESQGYQCNVGGIAGFAASITSCYIDNTTVKSNGGSCYIGGISANSAAISKCYVKGSEITESSGNTYCQIGGISGYNDNDINSSYVINTNVKGSGLKLGSSIYDYVGGICGYLRSRGSISNCYVYEDNNHSISKIDSNGEGKLGYLVGLLYKYDSDPSSNAKVTDSFCNMTTSNLSDLINCVGSSETSPSAFPVDDTAYQNEYLKNNYGGITDLSTFSGKTWSDGKAYTADDSVWKDYSFTNFPPTLKP